MRSSLIWIDTQEGLRSLCETLASLPAFAADTESDSFYRYPERLCLIQIFTGERSYLIDGLAVTDLSPLAAIFENSKIRKIFHAAEYDVACLKRSCPEMKRIHNLFDTMAAARILGWTEFGLAPILKNRFNVDLDKTLQRSNWGFRPLSEAQKEYAAFDVRYLLPLQEEQEAALRAKERWDEAQEEFDRLSKTQAFEVPFDPLGYNRIREASSMESVELKRLRELYLFREGEARRRHLPPFKILSDSTLSALALRFPKSHREITAIKGITPFVAQRYASRLLSVLEAAAASPDLEEQEKKPRQLSRPGMDLYAAIKEWRKGKAQERGVLPDVIISNDAIMQIAKHRPMNDDELAALKVMGSWKLKTYGEDILKVVGSTSKA